MDPWIGRSPWRRAWQPTPVFLPGESHGQRSLVGCSPWGLRVGDSGSAHTHTRILAYRVTESDVSEHTHAYKIETNKDLPHSTGNYSLFCNKL